MMQMTVLASGSKGNSTIVSSSRTRILVDAGLSCRELLRRMSIAGENPDSIDAILVTHEHQDHVQGVAVLARKLNIPVYFTEATHRAWERWMRPSRRLTYADWLEQRKREAETRSAEKAGSSPAIDAAAASTSDQAFHRDQNQRTSLGLSQHDDAAVDVQVPELREAMLQDPKRQEPERQDPDVEDPERQDPERRDPDSGNTGVREPETEESCDESSDRQGSIAERDPAALPALEFFRAGEAFVVGDIDITPFTIPHDAADPVGFVFASEGIRIGIATDLGYMPPNAKLVLRGCDVLMLESNHDLEMLRDGPYPWSVKQRVMSRVGHLSNDAAAEFLQKTYDGTAAYVVLAHLSQSNNLPQLARLAAERALCDRMSLLANKLVLAEQARPMEPIVL